MHIFFKLENFVFTPASAAAKFTRLAAIIKAFITHIFLLLRQGHKIEHN